MNQTIISQLFQEELYQYSTPVIVVLSKPWLDYNDEDKILLQKILASVKVDLNAVHIISQPALALPSLLPFSPAKVLVFGSETDEDIGLYQSTPAQGFIVIKADDLTQMDEGKKKNLWIALKQIFGL